MTSSKQFEANRRNAKNSSGPKTATGKASSKMNALKHGLTAETVVIRGEDPEEFEAMRQELAHEFAPATTYTQFVVDRLAANLWRLRRVPILEAAILEYECLGAEQEDARETVLQHSTFMIDKVPESEDFPDNSDECISAQQQLARTEAERKVPAAILARAFINASSNADVLGKLSKYEISLMRMVEAAIMTLERVKTQTQIDQKTDSKVITLRANAEDT